ncbi:DUF4279 domain-containing protein [Streptomyces sp. NPDC058620]|uniref:DUF4279 domain-containing protein n=1 Tax=Streptomyces sp. NPDC058620 TaxID=3346560 RepID=UPI0036478761
MTGNPHPEELWTLTDVTLVVKKSDLDPGHVTEFLGLQPSAVKAPGFDRWAPPGGDTDGQWRLRCDEHTTRNFTEQVDIILQAAERRAKELASLRSEGCETLLAVEGFADNDSQISFSAQAMGRICRLGLSLKLTPNLNER